jgi:hypothetical protein
MRSFAIQDNFYHEAHKAHEGICQKKYQSSVKKQQFSQAKNLLRRKVLPQAAREILFALFVRSII